MKIKTNRIDEIAEKYDASIHVDEYGHIALLRRHYDDEGIQAVRYAPDPCYFYPVDWWETASDTIIKNTIC